MSLSPGYAGVPAFIKNAGQLTLLSNMKNAPVVKPRRTRWGVELKERV